MIEKMTIKQTVATIKEMDSAKEIIELAYDQYIKGTVVRFGYDVGVRRIIKLIQRDLIDKPADIQLLRKFATMTNVFYLSKKFSRTKRTKSKNVYIVMHLTTIDCMSATNCICLYVDDDGILRQRTHKKYECRYIPF
jgi:hypothetical protein